MGKGDIIEVPQKTARTKGNHFGFLTRDRKSKTNTDSLKRSGNSLPMSDIANWSDIIIT